VHISHDQCTIVYKHERQEVHTGRNRVLQY